MLGLVQGLWAYARRKTAEPLAHSSRKGVIPASPP